MVDAVFDDFADKSIYNSRNSFINSEFQEKKIAEQEKIIDKLEADNKILEDLIDRHNKLRKFLGNLSYDEYCKKKDQENIIESECIDKLEKKCSNLKKKLRIYRENKILVFNNICHELHKDCVSAAIEWADIDEYSKDYMFKKHWHSLNPADSSGSDSDYESYINNYGNLKVNDTEDNTDIDEDNLDYMPLLSNKN